jgi:hypothetical protein
MTETPGDGNAHAYAGFYLHSSDPGGRAVMAHQRPSRQLRLDIDTIGQGSETVTVTDVGASGAAGTGVG